jgi:hypothetical protein
MGLLDLVRQNKLNAEKAQAFDSLQQRQREKQVYETGANDAYTDVERALMQRAQPTSPGLAATVQQTMRDNAYATALARAQREGNMSEEYINQLVEQELSKVGGL